MDGIEVKVGLAREPVRMGRFWGIPPELKSVRARGKGQRARGREKEEEVRRTDVAGFLNGVCGCC